MIEAALFVGEHGVTLALENPAPVITGYRDCLRMIREVGSLHLKMCFGARLERKLDAAAIEKAMVEVGPLQVLSHFGGEYEKGDDGVIRVTGGEPCLAAARGMFQIGYRGYIGYELCHPLPVVDGRTVGIEYVDRNARLAAAYTKAVIAEAGRQLRQTT